ncbi:MAG: DEAD/DEAH box helicase [Gemmatimonadota bacterium]|jgi:ATP-dependent RNA helicase RhlE|nr:DEAD/DEAH box helicase [Gemmatimonadota bacterium]MDQ8151737.1 DEAD/DEAH box helicase [Gemmatimonadota bacterium]MDQ8174042.1 DEAD/DEAH box helicase [Gemmatimonadota bacterium]
MSTGLTLAQAEASTTELTFADLGLSAPMLASLARAGYERPTPIQAQAVPLALKGRDLMGLAQTGTGKTAAFTIPIIERLLGGPKRTRALILTPTRELCQQVEASFQKYGEGTGLDVISIYGGVGYEPQTAALRAGVDVIVATPGRLIDHLEKQHVIFDDLEVLVLDEADRMLDMGFAPQINKIVAQIHPYRQTLLFSATMPPEVEALARKYLRKPQVVQVGRRSQAAATVRHYVYPVPKHKKTELLVHLVQSLDAEDSVLVFTRTKHGADRVVQHLAEAGYSADALHADKSQGQREQALARFKAGTTKILVATDIAQRGLDISGITHVINYDVPQQAEDYVHRIGRTGRAAKEGDAFTFMCADEIGMVRTVERVIGQEIPRISIPGFDFGT